MATQDEALTLVRMLSTRLAARQAGITTADEYYRGDHPLAFASAKFQAAFGGLFGEFADNWCDLVVDATEERLNVTGFRFGVGTGAESDRAADGDAWQIWQTNQLDQDAQIAHTEALICGRSFVLVWADDDGQPEITVEHASQMIVAYQAGSRRKRTAALKTWRDDDGRTLATLYLPDQVWKFQRKTVGELVSPSLAHWDLRVVEDEPNPLPNPLRVVPAVELRNRPRMVADPVSEIKRVIPMQDGVNKLVADLLVASEYGAFRQRWATGLDIPVDPVTGEQVSPFNAALDKLAINEHPEGRFGTFDASDLTNFVTAIEMLVQHIASQTRTPPHYFYLSGQFPSGESIKSAETGLVAKVHRKQTPFGEAWEEVIRLAFAVLEDARADVTNTETIWGDPESRTEGEHVDAVLKKKSLGVPWAQLMEDLGYSPPQIERMKAMRAEESALAGFGDPSALFGDEEEPAPAVAGAA